MQPWHVPTPPISDLFQVGLQPARTVAHGTANPRRGAVLVCVFGACNAPLLPIVRTALGHLRHNHTEELCSFALPCRDSSVSTEALIRQVLRQLRPALVQLLQTRLGDAVPFQPRSTPQVPVDHPAVPIVDCFKCARVDCAFVSTVKRHALRHARYVCRHRDELDPGAGGQALMPVRAQRACKAKLVWVRGDSGG